MDVTLTQTWILGEARYVHGQMVSEKVFDPVVDERVKVGAERPGHTGRAYNVF